MLSIARCTISIGFLALAIALATIALPRQHDAEYLVYVRILQVAATCVLLFGILRAHPQHKGKFVLIWLVATAFLFFALFFYGINFVIQDWKFQRIWRTLTVFTLTWSADGAVIYMIGIMYMKYVELTQDPMPIVVVTTETKKTKELLTKVDIQV